MTAPDNVKAQVNDGGPAFPTQYSCYGMTLRDKFAESTLQGLLAGRYPFTPGEDASMQVARAAYSMADAMLKVRAL